MIAPVAERRAEENDAIPTSVVQLICDERSDLKEKNQETRMRGGLTVPQLRGNREAGSVAYPTSNQQRP